MVVPSNLVLANILIGLRWARLEWWHFRSGCVLPLLPLAIRSNHLVGPRSGVSRTVLPIDSSFLRRRPFEGGTPWIYFARCLAVDTGPWRSVR